MNVGTLRCVLSKRGDFVLCELPAAQIVSPTSGG